MASGAAGEKENAAMSISNHRLMCALAAVCFTASARGTNVLTRQNDLARTGANTEEAILTTGNVNPCDFGLLYSRAVDGDVYAQPLVMSAVSIPGKGTHNVVFVATMHDSVYAFDADSNQGDNAAPLWYRSFLNPPGVTSVPVGDVGNGYGDIKTEVGINGTPVIDPASNTLYVVAKTKETSGGVARYVQRLHALDVTTGSEKFGGPVEITARVSGVGYLGQYGVNEPTPNGVDFNPRTEFNRPGLVLMNGAVYIGFAAHEDKDPYHGWVLGYRVNAGTGLMEQCSVYCSTPNGGRGGIWLGGGALTADAQGNFYVATGNGSFDATSGNYGDSFLRVPVTDGVQAPADSFTPNNQHSLDQADTDLGSAGLMVLPDQPGPHPHLLVGCGKEGVIYLIDRDHMGGYNTPDQVVQRIPNANNGVWGMPVYWNGRVYYGGQGGPVKAWALQNGQLSLSPVSSTPNTFGYPGATPAVSSNGSAGGILWALDVSGYRPGTPAVLHAYDATNLSRELYNTAMSGSRDVLGPSIKFQTPTVANGRVYVGTGGFLHVLGTNIPLLATEARAVSPTKVVITFPCPMDPQTASDPANYAIDNGAETLSAAPAPDGKSVTLETSLLRTFVPYTVTLGPIADQSFPARTLPAGTVLPFSALPLWGFQGTYYATADLSGAPVLQRVDPGINFQWGTGSPDPAVPADHFSVRWTGSIVPPATANWTFYTNTNDGVRLWVNNTLLINQWSNLGLTEFSRAIPLTGGTVYPLVMEYYENTNTATAELRWSAPGVAKAIVPPGAGQARDFNFSDVASALALAGGLRAGDGAASLNVETSGDSAATVDLQDAIRMARRVAGLE
jgi:hypothetical protein